MHRLWDLLEMGGVLRGQECLESQSGMDAPSPTAVVNERGAPDVPACYLQMVPTAHSAHGTGHG